MISYPIYVMMKETGEFYRLEEYGSINHLFEPVDIENLEYFMWDRNSQSLSYSCGADGNLQLAYAKEPEADIRRELLKRVSFERESAAELTVEQLLEIILLKQKREDSGLIAIWRRCIGRLFSTRK